MRRHSQEFDLLVLDLPDVHELDLLVFDLPDVALGSSPSIAGISST